MDTRTRIPPLDQLPPLDEAKRLGVKWCNRGHPCKHGHVAPWNWKGSYCRECLRIAQKRYEATEGGRQVQREAQARYSASDKGRAFEGRYEPTPAQRAYNRAFAAERYTAEIKATPPWLTESQRAEIRAIYDQAIRLTTETGVLHHVDHVVPLKNRLVCGLNVPWNLQVLTKAENLRKGNKFNGTLDNDGWRV